MTPEELLKRRCKVMVDYPNSRFKVGEIFSDVEHPQYYESFPVIFKALSWWEERKPEDMPKHLRSIDFPEIVRQVIEWLPTGAGYTYGNNSFSHTKGFVPITEEEYLSKKNNI